MNLLNRYLPRGFALPAVIFLMVIVTLLVGYMSRLLSSETAATNMDWLGAQVYWAAQSANEWAAYEIRRDESCPTVPPSFAINGFSISVSCTATAYTEGTVSGNIYHVISRAEMGSTVTGLDYVSRTAEMVLDVQ